MDSLETKVAQPTADYGDVFSAFEAFKDANDDRLAQIEKRQSADVITTEKVERINKSLDDLILKSRRPQLSAEPKVEFTEHKKSIRFICTQRRCVCIERNGSQSHVDWLWPRWWLPGAT